MEKVWISFHYMQRSNFKKISKILLFGAISINSVPFLTRKSQNKIQTLLWQNALTKGFIAESLDFP